MVTTDKYAAREVASLLKAHGIRRAVLSPGSRNAPLVAAVGRMPGISSLTVADERVAGFVALGMAAQSGEGVALVCTSGTALLNYAPAVAEAYYRQLPLIVVSADRPAEWIDQDDSQTMVQPGALAGIVKATRDIREPQGANRDINDALLIAAEAPRGPVHINVRIDAPLGGIGEFPAGTRVVRILKPGGTLPAATVAALVGSLNVPRRVLVVAASMVPDSRMSRAIGRLCTLPGIAVLAEELANIHAPGVIAGIDNLLGSMSEEELRSMLPDTVITLGGAPVSARLKKWLREAPPSMTHWQVGYRRRTADMLGHLSLRVDMDDATFMSQLATAMSKLGGVGDYGDRWRDLAGGVSRCCRELIGSEPWSDLVAVDAVCRLIPPSWNLHLGNGTAVRLAMLSGPACHRVDCNRGVSGIDGATSTAVGAALSYSGTTLLVTGDMGAHYDIGGLLAVRPLPSRFRMIVLANGGGNIFRIIRNTRYLDEVEERLAAPGAVTTRWRDVAAVASMEFAEVSSLEALEREWPRFVSAPGAAMLVVKTDPAASAASLMNYFDKLKHIRGKQI